MISSSLPCIRANEGHHQRVVLAVRALTSSHPANQEILAGTKKLGAADSSLLRELGLCRDGEGNIKRIDQ